MPGAELRGWGRGTPGGDITQRLSSWLEGNTGRDLGNPSSERKGLKVLPAPSPGEDLFKVTQAFGDNVWATIHG